MEISLEERLKNYLNLYWLRPENGLLSVFKSKVFEDWKFESPSLELSCGDGLFMAIHQGAIFEEDFDYFKSTKASEFKHSKFVDIYDHYESNYDVPFVKKPGIKIDYGTDWKQSLLDKASKTNLYNKLVLHDNNNLPLPFPDNNFKTIYSNSAYWVKNVESLMKEIHRITHPDGTVGLELMTPYHLETLEDLEKYFPPEAIEILDRKRRETMPELYKYDDWNEIISNAGFKITEARSVYPHKLILDIWNIGLRPISHLLIQMSDSLSPEERIRIKHEWIDIFYNLFKPLLKLPEKYSFDHSPYLYYILKK